MKSKIWILVVCTLLLSSLVFAAQQTEHEPGTGMDESGMDDTDSGMDVTGSGAGDSGSGMDDEMEKGTGSDENMNEDASGQMIEQETQNKGEDSQIQNKEQVETIKQEMEQKQQQMNKEAEEVGGKKGDILKNQNQVKTAAQTLSQMANMMGGIGKDVSDIAKGFENSVQATIQSEEKIQTRSGFSRFFAGGDNKAAEDLEKEVNQNKQKIQELKQLKDQCSDCDEEVKTMMQEQIQTMEKEQSRLLELAKEEKESKGLLGWIWK